MAILKAPLLSLGAKGQFGKTIVTSTWKGIKTGREYVIPANPQTTAQVAQRGVMSDCVEFWKTKLITEALRTAWNLAATANPKPLSGFNEFTSNQIKLRNAVELPAIPVGFKLYSGTNFRRLSLTDITQIAGGQDMYAIEHADAGVANLEVYGFKRDGTSFGPVNFTSLTPGDYYRISALDADGNEYWISGIMIAPTPA